MRLFATRISAARQFCQSAQEGWLFAAGLPRYGIDDICACCCAARVTPAASRVSCQMLASRVADANSRRRRLRWPLRGLGARFAPPARACRGSLAASPAATLGRRVAARRRSRLARGAGQRAPLAQLRPLLAHTAAICCVSQLDGGEETPRLHVASSSPQDAPPGRSLLPSLCSRARRRRRGALDSAEGMP